MASNNLDSVAHPGRHFLLYGTVQRCVLAQQRLTTSLHVCDTGVGAGAGWMRGLRGARPTATPHGCKVAPLSVCCHISIREV